MIIHDISLTISPKTVTWEGTEQGFSAHWAAKIGRKGAECNLSVLTQGSHTGTHVDAPLHFVPGGLSVEALDVQTLVGKAEVVEIYGRSPITAAELERANLPRNAERVLLKTDNTLRGLLQDGKFHPDYTGLAPSGAEWLVHRGVRLVGIDYLSIGPNGPINVETHKILLGAGIVIVESLVLDKVEPGEYTLIALPPKYAGLEGSPCRCLLIEGDI
ncbi:MAG: cyclase family protein [Janthinobacterium lividum]